MQPLAPVPLPSGEANEGNARLVQGNGLRHILYSMKSSGARRMALQEYKGSMVMVQPYADCDHRGAARGSAGTAKDS